MGRCAACTQNASVPPHKGWGGSTGRKARKASIQSTTGEKNMWSKPEYTEMRFGFEVTMYIANR